MRKHICKMLLDKEHIIMLKVTIRIKMKTDHYGYDFWLAHMPFTKAMLTLGIIRKPFFINFWLKFFAKVICNTKILVILSLVIIAILIVSYWCSTIKLQKYNEITDFFEFYSYPEFRLIYVICRIKIHQSFFIKQHNVRNLFFVTKKKISNFAQITK